MKENYSVKNKKNLFKKGYVAHDCVVAGAAFIMLGLFIVIGTVKNNSNEYKEEQIIKKYEAQQVFNAMDYGVEIDVSGTYKAKKTGKNSIIGVATECQTLEDGKYCKVPVFVEDFYKDGYNIEKAEDVIEFEYYETMAVINYWKK